MRIVCSVVLLGVVLSTGLARPVEWSPGEYRGLVAGRARSSDVRRALGRPDLTGHPGDGEDVPVMNTLEYVYGLADGRWEHIRVWMNAKTGVVDEIVLEARDRAGVPLGEALKEAGLETKAREHPRDADYHYTNAYGRLVYPRLGVTLTVSEGGRVLEITFGARRP